MQGAWISLLFIRVFMITTHKYHRSQFSYTTPSNGVVSHGAKFRGLCIFAYHRRKNKCKTNPFMIFVRRFALVLSFMQVTFAPDEPQIFWLWEKPEDPPIQVNAGIQMAQVLGSLVYICDVKRVCVLKMVSTVTWLFIREKNIAEF